VGYAPGDRIAWIAFTRGNVAIRLVCLDPRAASYPPMARIAVEIDRLILDQPILVSPDQVRGPSFVEFNLSRSSCVAGQVVPLTLLLADPAGQPAALYWVVGGPGQGYVEQDKGGGWFLHTTKAGAIQLTCHALGARGIASSSPELSLQVSDE